MHYTSEIATCLLTYEVHLISDGSLKSWNGELEELAVHVGNLREITARHFSSLSPEEFGLLREIVNLHKSHVERPSEVYTDPRDPLDQVLEYLYQSECSRTETLVAIDKLLKLLCRGMDDSERTELQHEFPAGKLPDDVTEILNLTYGEILKDYANGCYISAIALCGKVLETCLSALFTRVCGKSPEEEKLGFNAMINRLRNAGFEFHSATTDQMAVISAHRNKAIHGSIVVPTRDEARGVISLTKDVMLKAASK